MTILVTLLPVAWRDKAKAVIALLGVILTSLAVSLPIVPEWVNIAVAFLTAFGVYATPNITGSNDDRSA